MSGPVARKALRLPPYSGTVLASLRLIAVMALALAASGCATSGLGSWFASKPKDEARAYASEETTGSVASPRGAAAMAEASETDLVFARLAIVEVLTRGSNDTSAPWENPNSGARGTVTPIASVYVRDGSTCRDFLASYVREGSEAWLQGEACRAQKGRWEVKSLKRWTRS
jgi:surface antigen